MSKKLIYYDTVIYRFSVFPESCNWGRVQAPMEEHLSISICIPAYNEEKNIAKILTALLAQQTEKIIIDTIVVVSSGSTDNTDELVRGFCERFSNIVLLTEPIRNGKSQAINFFLKQTDARVIVVESADTVPLPHTIEALCEPFTRDPEIGMTGGAPIPVNDQNTFTGYIVHTWWWFHRNIPRFGEIIAFRNILDEVAATSAVDEAFIQAKMVQKGLKVVHVDEAVVRNKGPETVRDMIKQRRRIFNGHARLYQEEGVKINNMTKSSLWLLLFKHEMKSFRHVFWTIGGLLIEIWARILGYYDERVKKVNPFVWDTAGSTKDLSVS